VKTNNNRRHPVVGQNPETYNEKRRIHGVRMTLDKLTSRAGLAILVHYLESIGVFFLLERYFGGSIRKSAKSVRVAESFS